MRDVFTTDVDRIVIDNKEVADRVQEVIKLSNPAHANKVELYEEPIPLFHKYGIEAEIEQMYSRHVPLPSGGSLVIDSTEAIVAIDVNSGKIPRAQRRRDDRLQDRHGSRRRNLPAASSCAIWAA